MTMRQRITKVIADHINSERSMGNTVSSYTIADSVLAAMREPTDEMRRAVLDHVHEIGGDFVKAWEFAIDAATGKIDA